MEIFSNRSFITMDDNDQIHLSRVIMEFVLKSKFRTFCIPKYCSVLNPAEK